MAAAQRWATLDLQEIRRVFRLQRWVPVAVPSLFVFVAGIAGQKHRDEPAFRFMNIRAVRLWKLKTALRRAARGRRRYSTEPDQNSGEKSKTKPLCQLSVRPNPLSMSSGPGKWGRMWECWQACGLWVYELYSINLPERRIMAPR
jgi:hypothetical protein